MNVDQYLVVSPYIEPLREAFRQYGMMGIGMFLILMSFGGRFNPLALIPLVLGLGIVLAGAARLFPQ